MLYYLTKSPPIEAWDPAIHAPVSRAPRAATCLRKRSLDIMGALLGMAFLAPLLLLVAVLIRLDSKGPSLFRQTRNGIGGKPFTIYKFRTMTVQDNGDHVVQATRNDARITRIGAFLRRSSIDELPQLLNVLKGDMSLVGPRPHAVAHDRLYSESISYYERRFAVRPGLTGLAQVSGYRGETREHSQMAERIRYDLAYIAHWSFGLDLALLLRTVIVLPFDKSAY